MDLEKNDPDVVDDLWQQYLIKPSDKVLSQLLVAYEPLVKKIVGVYLKKKPANLDYDDLFQAGRMGLIDAISRFTPDKGASFKTYASIRIRGSILDEINSMDWTPRSVRKNIRSVISSIEKFYSNGGANGHIAHAVAEDTDFEKSNVEKIISQMNRTHMVNLEPDTFEFVSPSFDLSDQEFIIWFTMVVNDNFSDEEKLFISLKYFQEFDNKQMLKELALSPNEMNNLRKRVLYKFSVLLNRPNPFDKIPEGIMWQNGEDEAVNTTNIKTMQLKPSEEENLLIDELKEINYKKEIIIDTQFTPAEMMKNEDPEVVRAVKSRTRKKPRSIPPAQQNKK